MKWLTSGEKLQAFLTQPDVHLPPGKKVPNENTLSEFVLLVILVAIDLLLPGKIWPLVYAAGRN